MLNHHSKVLATPEFGVFSPRSKLLEIIVRRIETGKETYGLTIDASALPEKNADREQIIDSILRQNGKLDALAFVDKHPFPKQAVDSCAAWPEMHYVLLERNPFATIQSIRRKAQKQRDLVRNQPEKQDLLKKSGNQELLPGLNWGGAVRDASPEEPVLTLASKLYCESRKYMDQLSHQCGDRCVTSFDPHTGKTLWTVDGPSQEFVATPVYSEEA
ncbi:MAG: hypothetical protein N2C14_07000, partial [Planctomycetales bacterium]